jgi:hypothetical protein
MRVLVAVSHVYNPGADARYGSSHPDPEPRVNALLIALRSLDANLSSTTHFVHQEHQEGASVATSDPIELDIVVCTIGDLHVLDLLPPLEVPFRRHQSDARVEPMLAGFECRDVLARGLGLYDYYCYLEDDIMVTDPLLFDKIRWFGRLMGPECLLQPNRYELGERDKPPKIYIDGPIRLEDTRLHQEIRDRPEAVLHGLGREVRFVRPLNPHSGCYFLSQAQMERWASQPNFNTRDSSFVGPLESAATGGVMESFRIYKPALENASFFEVRHLDSRWWRRVAGELPWLG